jgi:hypothetical protein
MAAPDPNWLLSTMAQSSAAIVGLLGGFLISKSNEMSQQKQKNIQSLGENEIKIKDYQRKLDELQNGMNPSHLTRSQVEDLKSDYNLKMDLLNRSLYLIKKEQRRINSVSWGVVFLIFHTICGVLIPIILLPVSDLKTKPTLVWLFSISLLLVLGYFAYYVNPISENKGLKKLKKYYTNFQSSSNSPPT